MNNIETTEIRFVAFNEGRKPKKLVFKSTKKKNLELQEFQHFHEIKNRDNRILIIEYIDNTIQKFPINTIQNNFVSVKNNRVLSFWLELPPLIKKKCNDTSNINKRGLLTLKSIPGGDSGENNDDFEGVSNE